jgi:hypothetical protein
MADGTGDGLEDIVTQDAQTTPEAPILNLFVSESATRIAPPIQLEGLGFEFADVDADGTTDIVTTRANRLMALLSRGAGTFVPRDLDRDALGTAALLAPGARRQDQCFPWGRR